MRLKTLLIISILALTACGSVRKSTTEKRKLKQETGFENAIFSFEKKNSLLTLKERVITEKLDSAGNVTERTTQDREVTAKDEGEITTKEDSKGGEKIQESVQDETKLKRKRSHPWWLVFIPVLTIWALYKYRFKLITLFKPLFIAKVKHKD